MTPPISISVDVLPISRNGFEKHHRRPLAALTRLNDLLLQIRPVHETAGERSVSDDVSRLIQIASRLGDRLDWGPNAPLVVAVLGATGAGKSKLFNSLIGLRISPSGYKRPTTMAPVAFVSGEATVLAGRGSFLTGYAKTISTQIPVAFNPDTRKEIIVSSVRDRETKVFEEELAAFHGDQPKLVLIDTPDFDSVLAANRQAAADVFDRADAVIFVTDTVKYADQAGWDYLEAIRTREKQAILVVNRLKNPLSQEDFARRLERSRLHRTLISLPDQPGLNDNDLFPSGDSALQTLKKQLTEWVVSQRTDILAGEAARDYALLDFILNTRLLPELDRAGQSLREMRVALESSTQHAGEELIQGLAISMSAELKNSLIQQIQALFLRWDVLKYPRRLMSLPFNFVRDKVLSPLGIRLGERSGDLSHEIDRLFEANRENLVTVIQDFNRKADRIFKQDPVGRGLKAQGSYENLAFTPETVREDYDRIRSDLEDWVRLRAQELVKDLNLGEKMTFYLAQVVSLGLFISIQVHTGGGFSFFDGLLDSALAPILSKITGNALSRDKVKAFEVEAAERHQAGCLAEVDRQAAVYLEFLEQAEQGLASAGPLARAARDLAEAMQALK